MKFLITMRRYEKETGIQHTMADLPPNVQLLMKKMNIEVIFGTDISIVHQLLLHISAKDIVTQ